MTLHICIEVHANLMTNKQLNSLGYQIKFLYSANQKSKNKACILLTNYDEIKEYLIDSHLRWDMVFIKGCLINYSDLITYSRVDGVLENLFNRSFNKEDLPIKGLSKENLIKENLINENLINENLFNENLSKENLSNENLIKENLIKENLISENSYKANLETEQNIDNGILKIEQNYLTEDNSQIIRDSVNFKSSIKNQSNDCFKEMNVNINTVRVPRQKDSYTILYELLFKNNNDEDKLKVIYLTADADDYIQTLHDDTLYIIGGLIDRNKHKNYIYHFAKENNIKSYRLPIREFFEPKVPTVLTTNQVFEILLDFEKTKDWKSVFEKNIPKRKYKTLIG